MMTLQAHAAFVLAASALVLPPGPNVALVLATSLAHGRRAGLAVVAGTSTAMVPQLAAVAFGLAALTTRASHVFDILRRVGAAYLLGLGLRAFFAPANGLVARRPAPTLGGAFWRGFAVPLTNPKTLLFHGAFLPQFIESRGDADLRFAVLAVPLLGLAVTFDSSWVVLATRSRRLLDMRPRLRDRVTGTCLMGAAAGLALAHEHG